MTHKILGTFRDERRHLKGAKEGKKGGGGVKSAIRKRTASRTIVECTPSSIKRGVFRSSYSINSRRKRSIVATRGRWRSATRRGAIERTSHLNSAKFSPTLSPMPDCELPLIRGQLVKTHLPLRSRAEFADRPRAAR